MPLPQQNIISRWGRGAKGPFPQQNISRWGRGAKGPFPQQNIRWGRGAKGPFPQSAHKVITSGFSKHLSENLHGFDSWKGFASSMRKGKVITSSQHSINRLEELYLEVSKIKTLCMYLIHIAYTPIAFYSIN